MNLEHGGSRPPVYRPQVLPLLQEGEAAPEPIFREEEPFPPFTHEANTEICFFTCEPPHAGQVISATVLELRTSSSNVSSHSLQTNSKRGMTLPGASCCRIFLETTSLDAI
jgi:hypothetical protein